MSRKAYWWSLWGKGDKNWRPGSHHRICCKQVSGENLFERLKIKWGHVEYSQHCGISWNSNTLATSCEELTHWKRLWCWEGLGARAEGDDRGWDGWMASLTRWTWVWVNSGRWWWTGRPGVLRFMGSQRVGHDWTTELNWLLLYFTICRVYCHLPEPFSCISLVANDVEHFLVIICWEWNFIFIQSLDFFKFGFSYFQDPS